MLILFIMHCSSLRSLTSSKVNENTSSWFEIDKCLIFLLSDGQNKYSVEVAPVNEIHSNGAQIGFCHQNSAHLIKRNCLSLSPEI